MVLTEIDDERTRIKIVLKVSFALFPDAQYPLQLSLMYQPEATDGSIANLAEAHPIHVRLDGERGLPTSWSPWWVEENTINLQLEEDIPPSPTMLETFVEVTIEYPWIAMFAILMLTASALTYIRTRNASNVDLEFAFDDFEANTEETKEEVSDEEFDEEEGSLTHDELMKNRQIKRKIGRKKSQSNEDGQQTDSKSAMRSSYDDEDDVEPVVVRRRSASVKRGRDGTVVTGKRTKLCSGDERAVTVTTKMVATKKATVKTRRVVTSQNDDQVMDAALDRLTKDD
jgi:hypothetical protein